MHAFREAVEAKDHGRMVALLAEDVTFRSPVVHKPYEGREALSVLLAAIMQVLEDFRYEREIASGDDTVLVFRARVGDREVEGVDIIHAGDDGLIDEFCVMLRPMSGLLAAAEAMKAQLEAAQA
ncbi:MAG TPA: nuclear transport factor 2 family protein [Thermoleophilaceae bacterium]|nr:nuclear transport factor 2 family protein [Thermoleophilaceae bacterium]